MSYLQLPSGVPPCQKAIISLWFIVPTAALQKVQADVLAWRESAGPQPDTPPLLGIVPLVTFGAPHGTYEGHWVDTVSDPASNYNRVMWIYGSAQCDLKTLRTDTIQINHFQKVVGKPIPLDPCYIGVKAAEAEDPDSTATLAFNIQYPNKAEGEWLDRLFNISNSQQNYFSPALALTNACSPEMGTGLEYIGGVPTYTTHPIIDTASQSITYTDASELYLESSGGRERIAVDGTITVTPDEWHHLLLSFDFSGKIMASGSPGGGAAGSVSSTCKLWIALDDVNYTERDLYRDWTEELGNANTVATSNAVSTRNYGAPLKSGSELVWHFDYGARALVNEATSGYGIATYTFSPPLIPAGPLGLPATADLVNYVLNCEMAELQIWTDRTIDTGDESKRRLFIAPTEQATDDEDAGSIVLEPVDPDIAEESLGKPAILLHSSSNWIAGDNTGALTAEFQPTGEIRKYTPDPSIRP